MANYEPFGVVEEMRFAHAITTHFLLRKIDEKIKFDRAMQAKRTEVREPD